MYGHTGLISSIISKAREKVRAYYGLSGDPEAIRRDVEWLLKDSHFVYRGICLKDQTVDKMKPFGAQLIVDIIEAQWFPSTSRSKLDMETTNKIYEKQDLSLNVMLLVVTAIEHALKEWSSTGKKACQITFSEDTARLSYECHLCHWRFFESQMKAWPAWWCRTVLEQIIANHSNFDINAGENDFVRLDFSELDKLAGHGEVAAGSRFEVEAGAGNVAADDDEPAASTSTSNLPEPGN
ncbi:hypothetical protein CPB84DRAFT_1789745 [Gymnopilus junonius]|uniref:DUF6532 domain-containing protein n=1 Tax=Gymnopilus junonius TaxID=109634 RepID=A0A9P5NDG6_GYMJU|nr:hypothetical protein CPB84DRAFT_1789745 [Gymnopilus junonius]